MMDLNFYKYQGTGNDFVMIDDRNESFDRSNHNIVKLLCDRKFGVGADGLILLRNHADYDFEMIYYNADGFEGSMCGNGGRSIVKFAYDLGAIGNECNFIAVDGPHLAKVENDLVHLKMGEVTPLEETKEFFFIDTGSPHVVQFHDDVKTFDVVSSGKSIRYNDRFKSDGTNVNFAQKISEQELYVRTYERGVEDETLSCGTGVTACALTAAHLGSKSPIAIQTLGGKLSISFDKTDTGFENIYLIGPAEKVFQGSIQL